MNRQQVQDMADEIVSYIKSTYTNAQLVDALGMLATRVPSIKVGIRDILAPRLGVSLADIQAKASPPV